MTPLRVLVCGGNYGRNYILAALRRPRQYCLAGLLCRGSALSREVARRYGLRLFLTPDEAPDDIGMACAAMGASGNEAVLRLLGRGISVLCEHPQRLEFVKTALDLAERGPARFHLNGHFAKIKPVRALVAFCRRRQQDERPAFVDLTVNDRSAYGALDTLASAFGTLRPFAFERAAPGPLFDTISGEVAGTPAMVRVQRGGRALPDVSPGYLVDVRIAVGYASGVVSLLSLAGPVVWNANYGRASAHAGEPLYRPIHLRSGMSAAGLQWHRTAANLHSMDALARHMRGGPAREDQRPERMVEVAAAFEALAEALRTAGGSPRDPDVRPMQR